MNYLLEFKKEKETTETLISICIYNKKVNELINYFENELDKAKKISNPVKKHKINNRLFRFIELLKTIDENSIINKIYLLGDTIIEYELNKKEIEVAQLYNFINIFYKCNIYFYIDYFIDIFYNLNFNYYIKINKNELFTYQFNKNKEKILYNCKITSELKIIEEYNNIRLKYKDLIIIHGNSVFINKIKNMEDKLNDIYIQNEFLSKEDCYEVYENNVMIKNHLLLDNKLKELNNDKCNTDIFLFGKLKMEIKEAIESYLLKELYIEDKKLEKLKTFIDESYFNFKIIPIKTIKEGDIGSIFIKDYNGIMGIKYF